MDLRNMIVPRLSRALAEFRSHKPAAKVHVIILNHEDYTAFGKAFAADPNGDPFKGCSYYGMRFEGVPVDVNTCDFAHSFFIASDDSGPYLIMQTILP